MKLTEHLEKRRNELFPKWYWSSDEKGHNTNKQSDKIWNAGYDAAVADMLKEVEPLIVTLKRLEFEADSYVSREVASESLRYWQAKFGKGDE